MYAGCEHDGDPVGDLVDPIPVLAVVAWLALLIAALAA